MIANVKLYSPENVQRARVAQIAVTILAAAISAYLGFAAFTGVRDVWSARSVLTAARLESARLSRQAAAMKRQEAAQPRRNDGGVDLLALQLSRWAAEHNIKVESIAPQGAPNATDVTIDNESLGTWNAVKVRVEGYGDFAGVCAFLDRFRRPGMPVQLESFALQGPADDTDRISFDLMLTVYGRKTDET